MLPRQLDMTIENNLDLDKATQHIAATSDHDITMQSVFLALKETLEAQRVSAEGMGMTDADRHYTAGAAAALREFMDWIDNVRDAHREDQRRGLI